MNQKDTHFSYWPSSSIVEQKANENRQQHLSSAISHFMVMMKELCPHKGNSQWKKHQSRIKNANQRYKSEKKCLETRVGKSMAISLFLALPEIRAVDAMPCL